MSREGGKGGRVVNWEGRKAGSILRRQGWRGWSAVMWQVRKGGVGGSQGGNKVGKVQG